jgi:tetratricopeptide (TPR) repeat protein
MLEADIGFVVQTSAGGHMKTRSAWIGTVVLFGIGAWTLPAWAEEAAPPPLQGAEALIAKIQMELAVAPVNAPAKEDPARSAFKSKRDLFLQSAPTLSATQAATEWLDLADQFWKLPPPPDQDPYGYSFYDQVDPLSFAGLMAAVPPPETWPLILDQLETPVANAPSENLARQYILRAAMAFLNHDSARLKTALDLLGKQSAGLESYQKDQFREQIRDVEKWVAILDDREDDMATRFEQELKKVCSENDSDASIAVPDLAAGDSPEKAEVLLRKALAVAGLRLEISGEATLRLAQKIALSQLDSLPSPQWALVDASPDGLALFEGLSRKFAPPTDEDESVATDDGVAPEIPDADQAVQGWNNYRFKEDYETACLNYLFGLLSQNRTEDALKQALALKEESVQEYRFTQTMEEHAEVPAAALLPFLGQWLEAKPELALWDAYVQLATAASGTEEATQLLDRMAAREGLTTLQRFEVQRGRSQLLLALDRTDEAVALWRTLADFSAANELPLVQTQLETRKMTLAQTWAQIGRVLKRSDWFDEGLALEMRTRNRLKELNPEASPARFGRCSDAILDGLLEMNRFAEAEQRAWEQLANLLEMERKQTSMNANQPVDLATPLGQLITIYNQAGRHDDVLALFEKAPWWGAATNLANLPKKTCFVPAAQALHAAGRDPEAWSILTRYLADEPDDDKAYAVLVQIPNPDLIPFLNRLYVRDQFEERPLIWKAALLLKEGKLDEAETLARQALKVDPTDGEQPAGDRVRGYAVLADILTAKNKTEDAEFFYKVVKSVRIAEEGDKMNTAGLITRSLKLYAEAETYFANAYCVQWRLAERLQALGKPEEAQKHYQIAFERMPEQFGQVASLCFGCEGVFASSESRSAAETVLTRLATNAPARPAVFYLLGQLREEQKRYPEAYAEYKKAVELDPDYLDVWEQISGLRDHLQLTMREWDAIQLRMIRMDPFNRHICIRTDKLTDLKGLWAVQTEAMKLNLPIAENLLPLSASLEAVAQREIAPQNPFARRISSRNSDRPARVLPPGEIIATLPCLAQLDAIQSTLELSRRASRSGRYYSDFFGF